MNNVKEYKCFIASPGDTMEERNACEEVFEDINNSLGKIIGFRLSSLRCENDIYPSVGEYGQQVINEQVDGNYDLFIGIMKTRFGTPTPQAGSGTEEEFNNAYEMYKNGEIDNIFFYFGNPSISPYEIEHAQFQKVKDFRKSIGELGVLYMEYVDTEEFKEKLKKNLTNYFNENRPAIRKQKEKKNEDSTIIKSKVVHYEYRKLWEEIRESNDFTKRKISQIQKKSLLCRFSKIIFPQEYLINQLMSKEPLTEGKAFLFALAVKDIGQVPSYYVNYRKNDEELNKQPLWRALIEREITLNGALDSLLELKEDWAVYEQVQRYLFNLDFESSKELVSKWDAKGHWVQNKAMRMAVYEDQIKESQQLLDDAIKKEKNPSEKLYEITLANFISRRWPRPYSTDDFYKYGLDAQGDLLSYMMTELCKKNDKPKRRGWLGTTWNIGNTDGDYVKSLRILQIIIDSGIYVSIPGTYMFDIASWYIIFSNLYKYFPYACFFYSIQYDDIDVQRRIGEEYAYDEDLQDFNKDILLKSLNAISNENTPLAFKNGILNITAAMYVAVDETVWFELFKETVFKDFLKELPDIQKIPELVFNVRFALACIKQPENVNWVFDKLISSCDINKNVIWDIIANNLDLSKIQNKIDLETTPLFYYLLDENAIKLLDSLNNSKQLSDADVDKICCIICKKKVEEIPHNRSVIMHLLNIVKNNSNAVTRLKSCILSMDMWNCGISEDSWRVAPHYMRLHLLNKMTTWSDAEFEIIKDNLIKNVELYAKESIFLHQDTLIKHTQMYYLSDILKFIDALNDKRNLELQDTRNTVERLYKDRTQNADTIDLMKSGIGFEVEFAFDYIYNGIEQNGIKPYKEELDFMIHRAIMKDSVALTSNLKCIRFIVRNHCHEIMELGYAKKLNKLLSIYKKSESWSSIDIRFAFNHLFFIAKALKQLGESNDGVNFWLEDAFVRKFVVE